MRKRLLIAGGGHAHILTLAHLDEFVDKGFEVTVIGPDTHHYYSGMGPGMLGGTYRPEEIRFATQELVEKKGAVFLQAKVTGIDFSANSLRYAREIAEQEGIPVEYIRANYLDFETTDRFDLIMMIMCDFCALSPEQRRTMLAKLYALLQLGGSVLLDVHSLNYFKQREESAGYKLNQLNGFWSPDDYYCFVNTFKYEAEKVTLDKYIIVEESGTRVVYNWLQAFSQESLRNEFEEQGFKISGFYSDVAGTTFAPESPEFAVVATRPT